MERKFGIRDKLGYMFGDFGNDFFFILVSSYLMLYYTKILGINAAAVGTLFLVARCVDAFTDIGMGRIVDMMPAGKNGKFRPWIRRMALPAVLGGILLFLPMAQGFSMGGKLVFIYITYILWGSICYTSINIPYGSMASAITADPVERASLSTFRSVGASLAGIVVGSGVPLIIYATDAAGNQVPMAERFFPVALVFGILAFICYFLCYKLTTERVVTAPPKKGEKLDLRKTIVGIGKNKSLLAIIGAAIVLLLSMLLFQTMTVYLFMDYFKSAVAMSIAGFLGTACTFLLAPFASKIISRFGKKESASVALLVAAATYFLAFVFKITNPYLFLGFMFVGNMGSGLFNLMIWAFVTDVIDYQELVTGKREDGTVYAVYSFARKIGQALAGGLGGYVLALIGYSSASTVQAPEVISRIYGVSTLTPAIGFLLVALILIFFYPLNKQKLSEMVVALDAKHKEENTEEALVQEA